MLEGFGVTLCPLVKEQGIAHLGAYTRNANKPAYKQLALAMKYWFYTSSINNKFIFCFSFANKNILKENIFKQIKWIQKDLTCLVSLGWMHDTH